MSKQAQDFTQWYTEVASLTQLLMRDHGCLHHNGPNPKQQGCRACERRARLVTEWIGERLCDKCRTSVTAVSGAAPATPRRNTTTLGEQ